MLSAVLSCFVLAGLAPFLHQLFKGLTGWVMALLPAVLFILFLQYVAPVAAGTPLTETRPWLAALDAALTFRLDGLSLVFALLITGIGAFIIIYACAYLGEHPHRGRFLAILSMFMGSMLGLVLADNIVALFIFWELTSLTSFMLIGFDYGRGPSRRAAIQALVITGGGGLVLMAGLITMAATGGSWDLSGIIAQGDALRDSTLYTVILVLVLVGTFTKSAQVPFHFWLPNAMEAPTPVSAYLHSATMVKAGVYLLMRLSPALGGTEAWYYALTIFGGATLLTGGILSLAHNDLKRILAYTTLASLGLLVMLTGIGSEAAIVAAALYLVAHALFKGALFMVAGAVDHETGTRNVTHLGGLRHAMPLTFITALIAGASMAGLPPLVGFLAKEAIYGTGATTALLAVALLGNAMLAAATLAVVWSPFTGKPGTFRRAPHEAPLGLLAGPVVLSLAGLAAGLIAGRFGVILIAPIASAILARPVELDLALWHGLNLPLLLSAVTIVLGIGLYAMLPGLRIRLVHGLDNLGTSSDRIYDQLLHALIALCRTLMRLLQPGRLRSYLTATFVVFAASLLIPLAVQGLPFTAPDLTAAEIIDNGPAIAVMFIGVIGAVAVILARTRLAAIVTLGVQGVCVALLFLIFGAPDLAFTQFMVEILSVVILTLVMTRLRLDTGDQRQISARLFHGVIALAVSLGIGATLISLTQQPLDLSLSEFFAANSVPIAHGHNIVNVILVDFRGLDTLGEITVVLMAGLSALALIRMRQTRQKGREHSGAADVEEAR